MTGKPAELGGNPSHPMQPVVVDEHGITRFKHNAIVQYLLDEGPFDMNHLASLPFSNEDREQFAQLIGYSVSGAADLDYVSDRVIEEAMQESRMLLEKDPGDATYGGSTQSCRCR